MSYCGIGGPSNEDSSEDIELPEIGNPVIISPVTHFKDMMHEENINSPSSTASSSCGRVYTDLTTPVLEVAA